MSDLSQLALVISILLFVCGVILFIRYFPWKKQKPLYMKLVFDVNDFASFDAIMQIISTYDLIGANYEEKEDVSLITLGVLKKDYQPIFKSIRALPNVEVI